MKTQWSRVPLRALRFSLRVGRVMDQPATDRTEWPWLPLRLPLCMPLRLALCLAMGWLLGCLPAVQTVWAQDLSWVKGAMERSKSKVQESLPAWQYDPRIAVNNPDAALNSLCVVNPDRMWAVGDRGLVLCSTDGGRNWSPQATGTTLNLYGVAFADERRGVAVGGTIQPMSQTSVGIILITDDSGTTWRVISTINRAPLPRLTGVSFEPGGALRVWGDYSSPHQTGLFESSDRGQNWLAVPTGLGHIQSVAAQKHGLRLAVDRAGRLNQIPHSASHAAMQLAPPTSPIAALAHVGEFWLAVGSAGTVAVSPDGIQWNDQSLPLSSAARSVCAFNCIASFEQNVWIGGAPGSILLHSADGGRSWRTVTTGQSWSVNAIQFIDRHRGWLITSGGSVLATRDGGASWFPQRTPVKRLGFQAVSVDDSRVPWPALVDATWQACQASSLLVLHRVNAEDVAGFTPDAPSSLEAVGTQIGLANVNLVPYWPALSPQSEHLASLHRSISANHQRLDTAVALGPTIEHYLAMQFRSGRPSALLLDDGNADARQTRAQSNALLDINMRALELAASDSAASSWLSTELGLQPWKVSKLFSVAPAGRSDFTIARDQLLRDTGLSIEDALAPAEGWQGGQLMNTSLRCLQLNSGNQSARQSLLASSDRHPDAKRPVDLVKVGNLQLLMGRVHRQNAWQALAKNVEEPLDSWLKNVDSIVEATPRIEGGLSLARLADACWQTSNWPQWLATMDRLSQYAPLTDAARRGSLAIVHNAASDERLAWQRMQPASQTLDAQALAQSKIKLANPLESDPFDSRPANRNTISDQPAGEIKLVTAEEPLDTTRVEHIWHLRHAVAEFNRLTEADRAISARPDVMLAQYARRRALSELVGEPIPDSGSLQSLAASAQLAGWQQAAQQETALASHRFTPPAWTAHAKLISQPPALDGKANEPCWAQAQPIQLTNPFDDAQSSRNAAQVRFAYDNEFLYVLCMCATAEVSVDKNPSGEGRRYDMDLQGSDHVLLNVDTDRDYVSCCELAVNQFGHTYDRCCQSALWNPRWYVAVDRADRGWTAEYAVRLSDLSNLPVQAGRVWAISAFRYVPGGECLSWSQLRSYNPRLQGNGLLVFEP